MRLRFWKGLRPRYEQHHKVEITNDALDAAARLSDRYISDRFLPDKAIDVIGRGGVPRPPARSDAAAGIARCQNRDERGAEGS